MQDPDDRRKKRDCCDGVTEAVALVTVGEADRVLDGEADSVALVEAVAVCDWLARSVVEALEVCEGLVEAVSDRVWEAETDSVAEAVLEAVLDGVIVFEVEGPM